MKPHENWKKNIMSRIQEIRKQYERQVGEKRQIEKSLAQISIDIKEQKRDLRRHEQAREIIRQVGLKTQQQLQYHISDITSLSLEAVFPDPYKLIVEFVERRNKIECDLYFEREENKINPLLAAGGGAVDVASFALRVACWAIQRPKSRNVLILDEPFRYLSTNLLPKAGEMLKQISEKLKLQIIMVSHAEELIESADKVFQIKIRKGKSQIN